MGKSEAVLQFYVDDMGKMRDGTDPRYENEKSRAQLLPPSARERFLKGGWAQRSLLGRVGTPAWLQFEVEREADKLIPASGAVLMAEGDEVLTATTLWSNGESRFKTMGHNYEHTDMDLVGKAVMLQEEYGLCVPYIGHEPTGNDRIPEVYEEETEERQLAREYRSECKKYRIPHAADFTKKAADFTNPYWNNEDDMPVREEDPRLASVYALTRKWMLVVNPGSKTLYVIVAGTQVDAGIADIAHDVMAHSSQSEAGTTTVFYGKRQFEVVTPSARAGAQAVVVDLPDLLPGETFLEAHTKEGNKLMNKVQSWRPPNVSPVGAKPLPKVKADKFPEPKDGADRQLEARLRARERGERMLKYLR